MMKNYIWLNPVVSVAYDGTGLNYFLNDLGFEIVQPVRDYISIVKNKYKDALQRSHGVVLDQRCPKISDEFHRMRSDVEYHNIDPILIHVAKELADREDLNDGYKWVITPCRSLKTYGDSLHLKDTIFLTWDDFKEYIKVNVSGKKLDASPIPFGFFDSIEKQTVYVSKDNLMDYPKKGIRLIEGLYCKNGCHNGDGVQCINKHGS